MGNRKGKVKLAEMLLVGPHKKPDDSEHDGDKDDSESDRDQDLEDAFDDFENKSLPKSTRMDALALFVEIKR